MMVLVLSACPAGLRGDLTKWLMEVSSGVFVGRPSARVRDLLWERVKALSKDGRAIMVFNSDNEQGMEFRTLRNEWEPTDFDGLTLMRRPSSPARAIRRTGWSKARAMKRSRY